MKKLLLWIIVTAFLIAFIPVIPYEVEVQTGITTVEYKTIFEFLKESYEETQRRLGVVPPEMPEVSEEDVVPEGKHVQ
jgi:hypothetical protein